MAARPKRSVVTGGAGFLGYHLVGYLADRGDDVILIDDLSRGQMDAALEARIARPNIRLIEADLTAQPGSLLLDEIAAAREIAAADDVYHLAAINGTRNFYERPDEVLRVNIVSLLRVLDIVVHATHMPRLLFTSSNEAYAGGLVAFDHLPLPTPENVPLVIADPYEPRWSYGGSKAFGEQLVIHTAKRHQLRTVIVRPHNIYGPRAGADHVVPGMIARIERREDPFEIVGANETRSFCYVDDAVDALARAMEIASPESPTLHIGSEDEISIGVLAGKLFDVAGWRPTDTKWLDGKPGSVSRRCPDVSKIRALTGWQATTSLEDGLRKTWNARG